MDATIKEGNVGRSFSPVDKLKINLQNDGGESLWVPEDSVQLDELYTSTNGTYYAAPREIYGWGVVTVDVDNSIDEPDDLYDDDDYPDDDEPGGDDDDDQDDDSWDDWDDEPDEDWDEDGDEGDDEDEDEDDWEDDDWDKEDDEWGDDGITDGDEYNYLDDDGNLVEEECPAYIEVVNQPLKTEYTDGDSINLTGLAVLAYKADGSLWTQGNNGEVGHYAHGRIPNGELIIDQPTASIENCDGSVIEIDGEQYALDAVSEGQMISKYTAPYTIVKEVVGDISVYMYARGNHYFAIFIGSGYIVTGRKIKDDKWSYLGIISGGGHTEVAYPDIGWEWSLNSKPLPGNIDEGKLIQGTQEITVSWNSPCSVEPLTATFNISVIGKENTGGTTISGNHGGSHYSGKF